MRRRFWGRFNFARRLEWQSVLRLLDPQPTDLVCDVGCGVGTYSHMMARRVRELHGIDVAWASLKRGSGGERPDACIFECANAERLPFRNAVFDAVFSISTFEHLDRDTIALREMKRVMKEGGRAVLTLDGWSSPGYACGPERDAVLRERHIRRLYRLPDAASWLEYSGFTVENAHYLVRSGVSRGFHRLGSRLGYGSSFLFVALFPLLYVLAAASDAVLAAGHDGYVLVVAVRKPPVGRS